MTDSTSTAQDRPRLLTVAEACAELRISRWMFYRLLHDQMLRTITIGSRRLVMRDDLDAFLVGRQQQEAAS